MGAPENRAEAAKRDLGIGWFQSLWPTQNIFELCVGGRKLGILGGPLGRVPSPIYRVLILEVSRSRMLTSQELTRIVPSLPSLPVQPILMASSKKYAMFNDFGDYPWVLPLYRYKNAAHLLQSVGDSVIAPAEKKVQQILDRRDPLRSNMAPRPTPGRAPRQSV